MNVLNYEFGDDDYEKTIKERRIYSGYFFTMYFTHRMNKNLGNQNTVEELIWLCNRKDTEKAAEELEKACSTCDIEEQVILFERIQLYVTDLSTEGWETLFDVLYDYAATADEMMLFFRLDPKRRAIYILSLALEKVSDRFLEGFLLHMKNEYSRMQEISEIIWHNKVEGSEEKEIKYNGRAGKVYEELLAMALYVIGNELDLYDDLNYREHMEEVVRQRRKLSPVRLEMTRTLDTGIIDRLCRVLELSENQVFMSQSPLDLSFVFQIQDTLRTHSELFYPRRIPQNSPAIQKDRPVLDQVLEKDLLLSYPFESIKPFLRMLHEAAADPTVVSIKMTLYRLAKDSKVVEALVEAAENGKQVDVLVELKARFDEENNIAWSRMLEDAGCHVIYGLDGYKVHSKLCLITRKSGTRIEYITQIGTGNYNEKTSRLYTDLSLITSNSEIGLEAFEVFQALSLGETVEQTDVLFVAPNCLQNKVLDRIDREIKLTKEGKKGYLGFKLNSLTDKRIIDKLIEASQAGVQIDMVVRGICCLQPGIPGYTDHIRIISIVGRYLEHSRIYIFGTGDREEIYISSADFMTRNTLRRVEVSVPIFNSKLREELKEMFGLMLSDNVKARELSADGIYRKVSTGDTQLNSQEVLFQIAYDCAQTGKGEA